MTLDAVILAGAVYGLILFGAWLNARASRQDRIGMVEPWRVLRPKIRRRK
jgi:hypothetical protein